MQESSESCANVRWCPLESLSRRIGQRYGFAAAGLNRTDVALLGGVVHFELSHSQSKGDLERGNPIPFSQVHCVSSLPGETANFSCSLLEIAPAAELPCPRLYHSATRMSAPAESIVVFGGQAFTDKRKLGDIWCLELLPSSENDQKFQGQWRELAPASRSTSFPPPRSMQAVSACGDVLVVSGGSGFEDTVLGDMWVAQVTTSQVTWKRVNSPMGKVPCPRKSHALSPMVSEIELMLHGGIDANGAALSDLWIAQFVNDEKTRCVWTELVAAPHPSAGGHIVFPTFGVEDPKGARHLMVFGGARRAASRYNVDTGVWSETSAELPDSATTFTAVQMDVVYRSDETDYPIPSVLMIADTVSRTSPCSPWLASIFATDVTENDEDKGEGMKDEEISVPVVRISETTIAERRAAYRALATQLPQLPIPESTGEVAAAAATPDINDEIVIPQSNLFTVEYLASHLWDKSELVSASSWSGGNPNACHLLVTGYAVSKSFSTIEAFREFVNAPATVRAVAETANSCLVSVALPTGEQVIAFISQALQRHSGATRLSSPVVSLTSTPYAQLQATLRLIQVYSPFKSPVAIEELFGLFTTAGGFLLIDFDAESDNKAPLLAHQKPAVIKDAAPFYLDALRSLLSPRPRVEQCALTRLHATNVSVNGQTPTGSFHSVLKTKLLQSPAESNLKRFGSILIGRLKNGVSNVGVLVYSNGELVRHLRGRFPYESDENEDSLESAVNEVTGIVDVGTAFAPVKGALSDFQEAIANSPEWTQFVNKIEELCLVYSQTGSIN